MLIDKALLDALVVGVDVATPSHRCPRCHLTGTLHWVPDAYRNTDDACYFQYRCDCGFIAHAWNLKKKPYKCIKVELPKETIR